MTAKAPTLTADSETLVLFAITADPRYVDATLYTFLGMLELPS